MGTRLPCLMAEIRPPLSIMVKLCSKLVDSGEERERRGERGARPVKEGRIGMGLGRVSVMREGAQGREGREGRADLSVAMLHVQLALLPHAILMADSFQLN